MAPKNFEFGDLVWAKMKGYPPWPGKIIEPPSDSKSKSKKCHYVLFFGSENYAWILDDYIELHSEYLLQKYGTKKGAVFLSALQTIIEAAKDNPKYHESLREKQGNESIDETNFDNVAKEDGPSKNETPQKIKKKLPLKKVLPVKTLSQKKPLKKHTSQQNEPTSSSNSRLEDADVTPSVTLFTMNDIYMPTAKDLEEESKNAEKSKVRKLKLPDSDTETPEFRGRKYLPCPLCPPPEPEIPNRKYIERPKSPPIDLMYQSDFMREKKILPTKKKIGFLGLSKIGQAIVRNLYHTGHSIIIWNHTIDECKRFTEKFKLQIAKTPLDVVRAADITFCYMSDSDTAKELFFKNGGFLEEMEHATTVGKGYVELTSMDPKISQDIASEVRMKGGRYLEAPISGSRKEADEGTLFIMAAGDNTLYDDCKSCLDAITKENVFMSANVGMASKLDIVHNMVVGTVYAALAESLALINVSGLKGEHFKDILGVSDMDSPELLEKAGSMIKTDYTTDVALKHMQEQFNLGLALGDEVTQRTSLFAAAKEVYKQCTALGYGDHDVSAVYEGTKP